MGLGNLVRLNFYTTDVDAYLASSGVLGQRLGAAGVMPAGTLLGVARLAFPELMIEIEAPPSADAEARNYGGGVFPRRSAPGSRARGARLARG